MTGTWFIDAFDARAGFAVATQRPRDLIQSVLANAGPSAFITPPAFTPEFLDNRLIGFALARGRAQTGLFIGEQEVAFDNLAAVVEFVRRSYLRGAGGDGPAESGGQPPLPPGPRSGELGPLPGLMPERGFERDQLLQFDDAVCALIKFAEDAQATSLSTSSGGSGPPVPPTTRYDAASANVQVSAANLARGAFWVIEELVRRRPSLGDASTVHDWLVVVDRFVVLVFRMGLWPLIADEYRNGPKNTLMREYVGLPPYGELERIFKLLLFDGYPPWHWDDLPRTAIGVPDLFDDLALLPAPEPMATFARGDAKSLQTLLSGFVALPTDLLRMPGSPVQRRYVETVLFATACLNLKSDVSPARGAYDLIIAQEFVSRLVSRSMRWLDDNLARRFFATDVEGLIGSAATIPA